MKNNRMNNLRTSILFLCTGNSARSIMAEAIANHLYGDKLIAHSAGSQPKNAPNPLALAALKRHDIPTGDLRSKSWNEFTNIQFDLVVTLCNSAAKETCPIFPGSPTSSHWSFPDPPSADDPEAMFETVYQGLVEAINQFANSDEEITQRVAEVADFIKQRFPNSQPV